MRTALTAGAAVSALLALSACATTSEMTDPAPVADAAAPLLAEAAAPAALRHRADLSVGA